MVTPQPSILMCRFLTVKLKRTGLLADMNGFSDLIRLTTLSLYTTLYVESRAQSGRLRLKIRRFWQEF